MQILADHSSLRPPPKIAPPYKFNIGAADIVVVSDGVLDIGPPAIAFGGSPTEELERRLKQNFLPTKSITIPMNIPVISINGRNVIFETGIGSSKIFGSSGGLLQDGLIAAGIHPGSIDAVVCSHPHPDHIGGLCDDKGNPQFPNATIYLTKIDFDYWTDELYFESPIGFAVRIARNNLLPVRNRIAFFKDNEEFLPGIQAIFTPGHTAGHSCFRLHSGDEQLYIIGDLVHHAALIFESPNLKFFADIDPDQAVKSRIGLLSSIAETRARLFACHFPWPGLGHVAVDGDGFRYYPSEIRW